MPGLIDLNRNRPTTLKCGTCGEPLDILLAENGVIKCGICDYFNTLPKEDTSDSVREKLALGNGLLDTAKFDDAFMMFSRAADEDMNEPEAYFGMALAEYKIQYVVSLKDDGQTKRLQAIVHAISQDNFCDNINYRRALNKATPEQRRVYEERAQEIDYIRDQFYKFKNSGLKYDCFLCLKVTNDITKEKTPESRVADEICTYLRRKGFRPFYSEQVLENVTGGDYEAHILYALQSAECMVIVCYDEAHLRTKWVQNEYKRFLKLVNDEEKESDSITIVFGDRPIEKLPGKNGKIQGIRGKSGDMLERVYHFVERHTPEARKRKEEEEKAREAAAAKRVEDMVKQQVANMGAVASAPAQPIRPLLTRASQEMMMGNTEKALEYYGNVLDIQPECGEAWFGMMLLEFDCTSEDKLLKKIDSAYSTNPEKHKLLFNVTSSQYGTMVKKYADSALMAKYNEIISACNKPEGWYRMMLQDMGCNSDKELLDKIRRSYSTDKSKTDFLQKFRTSKYVEKVNNCAEGELRNRYETLWNASNDPASWYKVWLSEFGCYNDAEAERALQEACCLDENKNSMLFSFKSSRYAEAVASCATGEILARYNKLITKCNYCIEALNNHAKLEIDKTRGERARISEELNRLRSQEKSCRATVARGETLYKKIWLKALLFVILLAVSAVGWFFALGSVIKYAYGANMFKYTDLFRLDETGLVFSKTYLKAIGIPMFTCWGMTLIKGQATLGFIIQVLGYSIVTAILLRVLNKVTGGALSFGGEYVAPFIIMAVAFALGWFFILARYRMANLGGTTYLDSIDFVIEGSGLFDTFPTLSELNNYGISGFGGWGLLFPFGFIIQPVVYGLASSLLMMVVLKVLCIIDDNHGVGYRKNKMTYRAKFNNAQNVIYRLNELNAINKGYDKREEQLERIVAKCRNSLNVSSY